jgi:hypothetical protein
MAATIKVAWVLPTTRESGKPLAVADIDHVAIEMSADGGASYVSVGTFTTDVLETDVTELEPGEWFFRGTVVDTKGRRSAPVMDSRLIEDTTPPAQLTLNLSIL